MGRKYFVDEGFFDEITKESAWVLGWLITDGSVTSENGWQIKWMLKSTDREVLEKLKNTMKYTGKISDYSHKDGRKSSKLCICNRKMVESLYSLGIPKKDKTTTVEMLDIPDEYFWNFVRGVFEGDGHIRHRRGNTDALDITIAGASEKFILGLKSALEKRGVFMRIKIRKPNSKSGNKIPLYILNTRSNADALRMCYFMYQNTTDSFRLSRKFDVFSNYVRTYYDNIVRRSKECIELVELCRKQIPECNPDNELITCTKPFLKLKEAA